MSLARLYDRLSESRTEALKAEAAKAEKKLQGEVSSILCPILERTFEKVHTAERTKKELTLYVDISNPKLFVLKIPDDTTDHEYECLSKNYSTRELCEGLVRSAHTHKICGASGEHLYTFTMVLNG